MRRSQPYKLEWPLTEEQVANIDEMFQILFESTSDEVNGIQPATNASRVLGRGSASGGGDWQEIQMGAGLAMSDTTLNVVDRNNYFEVTVPAVGTIDDLDFSNASLIRMTNPLDTTIRGLAAGSPGQRVVIISAGAGNVFFAHQDDRSVEVNRLINFVTVGNTPLAAGIGAVTYVYDGTTNRWRLEGHQQGAYISREYAPGNFTASGLMTWTVMSRDVRVDRYMVENRNLTMNIRYADTSVGGTPSSELRVAIPGGYVVGGGESWQWCGVVDSDVLEAGACRAAATGDAFIRLYRAGTPGRVNYSTTTNTTEVQCIITFEIK